VKISVDMVKCQNHGQCAISAPTNFELGADGALQYQELFHEDQIDGIEDAIDSCPVQAIVLSPHAVNG
jgi:ferredoxin